MNFSFLTYNTLFNKAFENFNLIIKKCLPDIICLQEVDISSRNLEKIKRFGYKLADYSGTFIKFGKGFGVVTYYNEKKFKLIDTHTLKVGFNLSELLFVIPQLILGINKPKTILRTDFVCKANNKRIAICNSHLIVVASNSIRVKHINKALSSQYHKKI